MAEVTNAAGAVYAGQKLVWSSKVYADIVDKLSDLSNALVITKDGYICTHGVAFKGSLTTEEMSASISNGVLTITDSIGKKVDVTLPTILVLILLASRLRTAHG